MSLYSNGEVIFLEKVFMGVVSRKAFVTTRGSQNSIECGRAVEIVVKDGKVFVNNELLTELHGGICGVSIKGSFSSLRSTQSVTAHNAGEIHAKGGVVIGGSLQFSKGNAICYDGKASQLPADFMDKADKPWEDFRNLGSSGDMIYIRWTIASELAVKVLSDVHCPVMVKGDVSTIMSYGSVIVRDNANVCAEASYIIKNKHFALARSHDCSVSNGNSKASRELCSNSTKKAKAVSNGTQYFIVAKSQKGNYYVKALLM